MKTQPSHRPLSLFLANLPPFQPLTSLHTYAKSLRSYRTAGNAFRTGLTLHPLLLQEYKTTSRSKQLVLKNQDGLNSHSKNWNGNSPEFL